jgi:hypothetical protein
METDKQSFKSALEQFNGTENYYRLPICGTLYTDGVQFLATEGKAFWLVTDASIVAKSLQDKSRFIIVDFKKLTANEKEKLGYAAKVSYSDGNGQVFTTQFYHLTDFPLETLRLYFIDNILLLPSEY